ncbi:MAG: sugar phosphate isomerase/epimerase family protein [bacterium]
MDCRTSIATSPAPTTFGPLLFAGDVPAAAKAAGELGFDGIEINMKGPEELSPSVLRGLLDRHGLELTAVASGRIYIDEQATLSDPDEGARMRVVKRVNRLTGFAGEFGAPVIIGLLRGERLVDGDAGKTTSLFVQSMQEVAEHAATWGIDIFLEAINRYETPLFNTAEQTVEVVKRIDRPNVKVLLDVFHMNIEEVSIGDAIRATGDLLGHFHIVDSNRRAPGMGHVAYGDIAAALREIGYNGWLSGEHLPLPDSYTAAKQTRSFIRDL